MSKKQTSNADTKQASTARRPFITVCDKCLQASCWQGIFMCDEAQFAGTVEKTIDELKALNLEHPDYWEM